MALLAVDGLQKRIGSTTILDGISFDLADGECLALLGPSGCGKTTTLRCIAGLERPDCGQIRLAGKVMTDGRRVLPPQQREMGMVFQSYSIWPHLSVFDNVAFGLRLRRVPSAKLRARVLQSLELAEIAHLAQRRGWELSGGQLQRVALARTLVVEPRLVLFDEPLSNLDAKLRIQMRVELRLLMKRLGISAVYVTHDQLEASVVADRTAVMNKGRIEQIGTWADLYFRPASRFVAGFMSSDTVLEGTVMEIRGETARVDLGAGLPSVVVDLTPSNGVVRAQDRVAMYIPREAVLLRTPIDGGWIGRIESVLPSPGFIELIVEIGDGRKLAAVQAASVSALTEGAACGMGLDPSFIRILPNGTPVP